VCHALPQGRLSEHDVRTVDEAGFKGLKNGALLLAANTRYDVLVTVDRNLPYQQNLKGLRIAIVILVGKTNAYESLKPLAERVLEALKTIQPGQVSRIEE
jgi:hypothetical protein